MCKLHYSNLQERVAEVVSSDPLDFCAWLLFLSDLLIFVVNGVYALAAMAFMLHLPAA